MNMNLSHKCLVTKNHQYGKGPEKVGRANQGKLRLVHQKPASQGYLQSEVSSKFESDWLHYVATRNMRAPDKSSCLVDESTNAKKKSEQYFSTWGPQILQVQ